MRIIINNKEVITSEGETILDAALRAGIRIPTLCHQDGVEPYSSCMVCIVKDIKRNSFIPSCSALVEEGMEIDASGEEVIVMRRKAVELLLSEHRAECEAPCRIVCPAGYNIPLMNRLLAAGNFEEATELIRSEIDDNEIRCLTCKGYCENACRRKKIDEPVSIRNIRLFLYRNIVGINNPKKGSVPAKSNLDKSVSTHAVSPIRKRFSSRIGRLDDSELTEWLKECGSDGTRFKDIDDFNSAGKEAENCMHCDCRAANDCRLREIAEELSVKDPSGKLINNPLSKKISHRNGLIFENGKCIKCGLCVRVCEDKQDEPSLCFINRGFISIISEPLTEQFDDILEKQADVCVQVCPTGALRKLK